MMFRFSHRHMRLLAGLLAALAVISCTQFRDAPRSPEPVAAPLTPWPHERSDLKPDPTLVFGRLPNGFRYVLMPNTTPTDRVSMHLDIQAGSMEESDAQQGLAHFLEHMMFNGSEHFRPGELVRYFQDIGMEFGPDANAHTGFYETVYDILLPKGDPESLSEGLMVLQDYAQSALLLPEEIDRERKVILAEMRTRDSAAYRTFVKTLKFELPEARVTQRLPIGQKEILETADRPLLKAFYDTWYRPDKIVLVMVGDFDTGQAEALIRERFSAMAPRASARPEPDAGEIRHAGIKAFYHHEKEAGNTEVTFQVLEKITPEPDSLALQKKYLILDMANQIIQNRLSALIRKPDTPFTEASAGAGVFLRHVRYAAISAESSPENWLQTLSTLEQTLRQALTYGFTKSELERVRKDYLAELDRAVRDAATRESSALARQIIRNVNADRVLQSPGQIRDLFGPVVREITPEVLHSAFQQAWAPDHRMILVTGNAHISDPKQKPESFILSVFEESHRVAVARPAEEEAVAFPYLPKPETPGRITDRRTISDLGITQIDFENGFRLNLKPTDFRANEVVASLSFGSGRASEPADKPGLAWLSEAVVNESGLGRLTSDELERALAGKNTGVGFNISQGSFSFDGQSVSNELPLLFQILYAHLTDPGFREDAYALIRERFEQKYRELARSIEGAMPLSGQRFLAGGDSRFGLPPYPRFQRLILADVRAWIRKALASGHPELSIVGDFDPDLAVELAARYFGSLPAGRSGSETARRDRPVFPSGEFLEIDVKTLIDKGLVRVAYPTDDIWDISRTRRLATLAKIFSERLREVIREKLGATYSPYAYNAPSRTYPGYGVFQAVISVRPDDAEQVVREVKQIIADLAAEGVSQDELKRAVGPTLNSIKDMRQENGYWLNTVLNGSRDYPQQIDWSRTISDDYAGITAAEVSALAREYLNNEKAAVIIIRPDQTRVGQAVGEEKS